MLYRLLFSYFNMISVSYILFGILGMSIPSIVFTFVVAAWLMEHADPTELTEK